VSAWTVVHTPHQRRSVMAQGIARVAADENFFEAAHHGAGAKMRSVMTPIFDNRSNAQVAFNAGNGIDDDTCHRPFMAPSWSSACHFRDHARLRTLVHHGVRGDADECGESHGCADGVRRAFNAEAWKDGRCW